MTQAVHVVCPHCGGINRVPQARLVDRPVCGRCHEPLFTGKPLELDSGTFTRQLKGDLPLVVDFWAPWCGPCKMMAPAFAQVAAQLEPQVRLVKVNTEEQQQLAQRFAIRSIPTLIIFRQGRETARVSGAMDATSLSRWIGQHI